MTIYEPLLENEEISWGTLAFFGLSVALILIIMLAHQTWCSTNPLALIYNEKFTNIARRA
jgi:hypothetical protein